jgi:hypothetical protein
LVTYLYIKEHSITGLRYFGKTGRKDVNKYLGSGLVWTKHIKKHGKEHVKTIWVSEPFTDESRLVEFATFMSEELDIVKSNKWANLVVENGIQGGAIRNGAVLSEESKDKIRKKAVGRKASKETKLKMSSSHKGRPQTEKQKQTMRDYNLSRNLPKLDCPHCNKVGSYVAMHRWHFNNCKHKGELKLNSLKNIPNR